MTAPPFKPARVEQQHELVRREAFSVAGLSRRFGEGAKLAIPGLWQRLIEMMPFDGQSGPETYGVVTSVNREDGSFRYMAAGRLNPAAETPKGLERKDIPANTYVVFRITMAGGPVHPQIKAVMQTVWGELIPASGLNAIDAPDFELYSGGLPPDQAGAVIDYHVPVRA